MEEICHSYQDRHDAVFVDPLPQERCLELRKYAIDNQPCTVKSTRPEEDPAKTDKMKCDNSTDDFHEAGLCYLER
jgi:hypothetical protein